MVKRGVLKKGEKYYVELPEEFSSVSEIELFPLKDGFYLLSFPLERKPSKDSGNKTLMDAEKAVLKKLTGIKFEKRTPENVNGVLTEGEKKVLMYLMKKKYVNEFKSRKYPKGVYNIADSVYPLLRGESPPKKEEKPQSDYRMSFIDLLKRDGYLVIPDSKKAYAFTEDAKKKKMQREFVGVRNFDGRFYVATRRFMTKAASLIRKKMKDEMDVPTLAEMCNLPVEGVRVIMNILANEGEVVEKRKDVFAVV